MPGVSPLPSPSISHVVEPHWVSLGTKRAGMAAVASAASLSVLSVCILSAYIAHLLRQHYGRSKADRLGNESRAIKFLTSSHGMLLGNLLLGDFLQALGFLLNWRWIARGALPAATHVTQLCTAQGVFIQVGDLGSAFSSLVICVNLFLILVFQIHPSTRKLWLVMVAEWGVIAVMALVGPVALERDGVPFYGPSGGWCWMSSIYQSERLTLHYLWVFIIAALNLLLYSAMAVKIWHQRRAFGNEQLSGTAGVAKVMMLYPLVYIVTILPLSCYRVAAMAGKTWPIHYALAAGFVFTLSGTANCLIYAFTRSIVSFDSLTSALRRTSNVGGGTWAGRSFDTRRLSGITSNLFSSSSSGGGGGHGRKSFGGGGGGTTSQLGRTSFALNGVRIDVETDVSSPDLMASGSLSPALSFDGPAGAGGGAGGGGGRNYTLQFSRRGSRDAGLAAERPFSMSKKLEEEEEELEAALAEGEGEEESVELHEGRRRGSAGPEGLV
ncbi:hypothetical protein JCM8097_009393 [Rhodosporidiobolus ruineniae]